MKNNIIKNSLLSIILMTLCISFASCDKDDDNDNANNLNNVSTSEDRELASKIIGGKWECYQAIWEYTDNTKDTETFEEGQFTLKFYNDETCDYHNSEHDPYFRDMSNIDWEIKNGNLKVYQNLVTTFFEGKASIENNTLIVIQETYYDTVTYKFRKIN